MTFHPIRSLLVLSLVVSASQVSAALLNPSFESIRSGATSPTSGNWTEEQSTTNLISNWTRFNESTATFYGQVDPGTTGNVVMSGGNAAADTYVLMLKVPNGVTSNNRQAMYQAVGTVLADTDYTFSVSVGSNASTAGGGFAPLVRAAIVLTTNPTLALNQGPEQHANLQLGTHTDNLQTGLTAGIWGSGSVTLDKTTIDDWNLVGQPLYALIWARGTGSGRSMLLFDNAQLTVETDAAAVPEPSTLALTVLGLLGLAFVQFRRRSRAVAYSTTG